MEVLRIWNVRKQTLQWSSFENLNEFFNSPFSIHVFILASVVLQPLKFHYLKIQNQICFACTLKIWSNFKIISEQHSEHSLFLAIRDCLCFVRINDNVTTLGGIFQQYYTLRNNLRCKAAKPTAEQSFITTKSFLKLPRKFVIVWSVKLEKVLIKLVCFGLI